MNRGRSLSLGVLAADVLLVVTTVIWLSGPDMMIGWMLPLVAAIWGLLGIYVVAAFAYLATAAARRRRPEQRHLRGVAIVPLTTTLAAVAFTVILGLMGTPEQVRLSLSRDALIEAGKEVLSGSHPTRAGLYGISATSIVEGCALLETGSFAIDSFGWAYCPSETVPSRQFQHVHGPLYSYAFD